MPGPERLYIESDGQVYLVRDAKGHWSFPLASDDLPFATRERHRTTIDGTQVVYVHPELDHHPEEWVYKEDVPLMNDVDPLVRAAVNASHPRFVVGVLIIDSGRVLMVKSNRGFSKGIWNMPGGFVEYGEHPEAAAAREIMEETGLTIDLGELIGVYKKRFSSPYFMLGMVYDARATSTELRLEPNEIEEARWMEPAEAALVTRNPFAENAIRQRFGLGAPDDGT